ncbi:MAG: ABC transporter permease [Lachnospiraceae bacterium]|nr:ABC transporter permease [Lachnospiraceae bacterium]
MLRYVLKRLGLMVLTLFVIMTLCFFVIRLMPGSPFDDPENSPALQALLEEKHHLNESVPVQYYYFWRDIAADGYWGVSLKIEPNVPVWQVLRDRIPVTLSLNLMSLLIAIPFGILAGAASARFRKRLPDHLIGILTVLFISVPSFVFASGLQYLLGYRGPFAIIYNSTGTPGEKLFSLLLPVLALSFWPVATICRYLRGELLENMNADYMLLARAKGLSEAQSISRHAFRNSMVPLVNVIVPLITGTLTGSLVVEKIFSVPGVGGIMTQALAARDYWLVMAVLVFYSLISLGTVLLMDLLYGVIDPRIRLAGKREVTG